MSRSDRLRQVLFLGTLFMGLVGNFAGAEDPPKIRFGLLPGGSPARVREQSIVFAKELQKRLGIPVEIVLSDGYAGIVEAFRKDEVDYGFLTPQTYVKAEKEVDIKVLLKRVWDGPFYYSAIIVPEKSKIQKLSDLRSKKMVFVDEFSTSGYLYPIVMLKKAKLGLGDLKITFSGNHEKSIEILSEGKADAAAVFSDDEKGKVGAWTKFPKNNLKVRVLAISEPIPNDPFCVRSEFYKKYGEVTYRVMSTLIDMNQDPKLSLELPDVLGAKAIMPATSRQYDPIRELLGEVGE